MTLELLKTLRKPSCYTNLNYKNNSKVETTASNWQTISIEYNPLKPI